VVLLLTHSAGYEHAVVKGEPKDTLVARTLSSIGKTRGFEVQIARDVSEINAQRLEQVDVVAFYTTGPLPFGDDDYAAFEAWLDRGGAFLGIHCATDTLKQHARYPRLVGGVFDGHPWMATDEVVLKVHDDEHPASRPIPQGHTLLEEIYKFREFRADDVRVLVSLDMERTRKKEPLHVPIAWCREVGAGRLFYTSLGHREDVWSSSVYQDHLAGAIAWLMGDEDGRADPNPEVHAAAEILARAQAGS